CAFGAPRARLPLRQAPGAIAHHLTPDGEIIGAALVGEIVGDTTQYGSLALPLERTLAGIGILCLVRCPRRPAAQSLDHLLPAHTHRLVSFGARLCFSQGPCSLSCVTISSILLYLHIGGMR